MFKNVMNFYLFFNVDHTVLLEKTVDSWKDRPKKGWDSRLSELNVKEYY